MLTRLCSLCVGPRGNDEFQRGKLKVGMFKCDVLNVFVFCVILDLFIYFSTSKKSDDKDEEPVLSSIKQGFHCTVEETFLLLR